MGWLFFDLLLMPLPSPTLGWRTRKNMQVRGARSNDVDDGWSNADVGDCLTAEFAAMFRQYRQPCCCNFASGRSARGERPGRQAILDYLTIERKIGGSRPLSTMLGELSLVLKGALSIETTEEKIEMIVKISQRNGSM